MASKRQLELQDALASLDAALTEHRFLLDGHARGRRYKQLAEVGAALVSTLTAVEVVTTASGLSLISPSPATGTARR